MQIVKSEKAAAGTSVFEPARFVSLYQNPPQGEITLEAFEGAAWDRLRLLQAIEQQASTKDKSKVLDLLRNFPLRSEDDSHRDTVAHYAMRLAYARPSDRLWFVRFESALLHMRLDEVSSNAMKDFLKNEGLQFPEVDEQEFLRLRDDLLTLEATEGRISAAEPIFSDFFKLRFEDALDMVRNRSALLKGGYVYVHKRQITLVICARFRVLLHEALSKTYLALPHLQQSNERLAPLLSALTRRITDFDYRALTLAPGERVRPSDLDGLAMKSYPLCMKRVHQHLRANHHLKHTGRLQYGLFLKGIGLTMEDALDFWRAEFTRGIPLKTFESNYSYNIRHSYGKEGKGTDYTPYACDKIISFKIGNDELHGCPFKLLADKELLALVSSVLSDKPGEARAISDEAKKGIAQLACSKYFEATHSGAAASLGVTEVVIKHPNNYFKLSRTYWQQKEKEKAAAGAPAVLGAAT